MIQRKPYILLICIFFLFIPYTKGKYYFIEGFAQGTSYHITYQDTTNLTSEIDSILKAFDLSLSAYNDTSLISRINRNEPNVVLDKWFVDVFNKAKEVYETSDGMFDITVGPLVKAWGFLKDSSIHHDNEHIKYLLNFVGMDKIYIKNNRLIKKFPETIIDVNAIAQGYSVDVVADFLDKQNIENYLVEIGGEVKAKGKNPKGNLWKVGIDKPVDNNQIAGEYLQTIIEITDKSLATSGNYRKFFVENGIKYAHSINPKTGFPSKNALLSVTIIADDCITADAYATACLVSGLDISKKILTKINTIDGYFIYSDSLGNYQEYITPGLKDRIVTNN